MKLPALLIAVFVAAGVLAASPIAAHTRHSLDLSLGVALFCLIAGFGLVRFRGANLAWAVAAQQEQRQVMGDHFYAYNVVENTRPLEAMMQFSHQFGLTPTKLDYRQFLHAEAAALAGW